MEVTLVGIVTDVSDVHPRKASYAMLVVVLPNVIIQGVVVHRLQQPLPVTLLQTTVGCVGENVGNLVGADIRI